MYKTTGILHYDDSNPLSYKLVASSDDEIVNYYRKLIPKSIHLNKQMYPAHVSIVRKEIPPNLNVWGKYENQEVEFYYSPVIHSGTMYYWINVFSVELEKIRGELGLRVDAPFYQPPEGFAKTFHMTIGNIKTL